MVKLFNAGDLSVFRGDTMDSTLTFTDGTNPINITGYTVFFTVRDSSTLSSTTDTDAIIQKTITSHTSPSTGVTNLSLTATDTAVESKKYVYDIQFKDGSGKVRTAGLGNFTVYEDVTKRTV
jgi:hypothetical protein